MWFGKCDGILLDKPFVLGLQLVFVLACTALTSSALSLDDAFADNDVTVTVSNLDFRFQCLV